MVGERRGDAEQTIMRYGHLGIVVLVEAGVVAIFHDPRVGIGEVVLVFVPGAGGGGRSLRARPASRHTRLFPFDSVLGTGFQDRPGFGRRASRRTLSS
jgi:hypothetical protein